MNADNMALTCQGMGLSYGKQDVLKDIHLAVPVGAVVGLVGRNGAGKSTLMRSLVGLSVPQRGQSHLLGCNSQALHDATRERIGYVGQTGDLLPWLNVWQHVEYIGSFYKHWQAGPARALCQRLALNEKAKVSALSVGEQQKLAIVLALAHDPDLLVLDEPVASLDPMARRDFMRLLFEGDAARSQPRTVLLSSHLLSDLQRVVSHVVFMREGQVQLQGAWDELLEQVRRYDLPAGAAMPPGLLHAQPLPGGGHSVLVDLRQGGSAPAQAQALALENLFVELNT
jgi:ABC-2 type transport system ATP-binding protein